jgi:hypothetical protein
MKRNRWGLWLGGCLVLWGAGFGPGLQAAETNAAPAIQFSDDKLDETVQAAVLLARMGLYDEAEERCRQILAMKPDQPAAKQLLAEIQQKRREGRPSGDLRQQLNETIIPEVSVREAPVIDVIEYLIEQSQKLSGDPSPINLVWQAPEDAKAAKVTLSLRKIPFADVLKYVTEIAGLRYRIDAHAIVIYKPGPTASKNAPPPNAKPR